MMSGQMDRRKQPSMDGLLHNRITRPLLYQSVIQRLLEIVESGEVMPGDPFPPERELVIRWGISRNVLREAFHVLSERGIVNSIQGKGRFLRKLPNLEAAHEGTVMEMEKGSLTEIYEVRLALESFAIDIAVERASDLSIKKLENKFSDIKVLFLSTKNVSREFEIHLGYASLAGNFMLEQMVGTTMKLISDFMSTTFIEILYRHNVKDYIKEHGQIIEFIKHRNATAAKKVLVNHFNRTTDWILNFKKA